MAESDWVRKRVINPGMIASEGQMRTREMAKKPAKTLG